MAVYTQTDTPALVVDNVFLQTSTSVGDGGSVIKNYNWAVHYTPDGRDQTVLIIGSYSKCSCSRTNYSYNS